MTETNARKLVALIGCSDEWLCRSLESLFAEKGYDVTRTGSGKQALKLARRGGYAVLMLDEQLNELTGVDVCVALRDDPLFDHAVPIVIISSAQRTLPGRMAACAAGAWEYCHLPLDADALFLKLGTFRPGDIRFSCASIEKARKMLSFSPTHSVAQGLEEAMDWYVARARKTTDRAIEVTPRYASDPGVHSPLQAGTPLTLATS